LQVGAFKDRATAESMVTRLKGKGFGAYLVTPQAGLFNVRVGNFASRAEAETAQEQLRGQKFDPFVVRN
jgi:cell division septation protein DedD